MNRFLWVVQGDLRRLKLAAICQFTLPHPPIIYYGSEVGLSQARDVRYADGSGHPEESRRPMLWGDAQSGELLDFYRRLSAMRRSAPGLWRGARRTLAIADEAGLYAYSCGDGAAIVVLNNGNTTLRFGVPPGPPPHVALTSDDAISFDGDTLTLTPFGGAVLFQSRRG